MNETLKQMTLGDIVTKYPKAADILQAYEIDFCCHGDRTLDEVSEVSASAQNEVLSKLEALHERSTQSKENDQEIETKPSIELIEYIINKHHKYLYEELPKLERHLEKIVNVHGGRHSELKEVQETFLLLKQELLDHLEKEERRIFPAIRAFELSDELMEREKLAAMIDELEGEHEAAGALLKKLRTITDGFKVPDDGCATYALSYQKLGEMESDTFRHIHLENNILFKRYAA